MAKRKKPRSTLSKPRYVFKDGSKAHKMSVNFVIDEQALQVAIMDIMFKESFDKEQYVFYRHDLKLPIESLTQTDISAHLKKELKYSGYDFIEKRKEDLEDLLDRDDPKVQIIKKIMIKLFPAFVKGESALKFITEED